MWRCPVCKSKDHLEVVVETWVRLIQPDDDPEAFQADQDEAEGHDQEWGSNSVMMCVNPKCPDERDTQIAEYFEVEEDEEDEESEGEPESPADIRPADTDPRPKIGEVRGYGHVFDVRQSLDAPTVTVVAGLDQDEYACVEDLQESLAPQFTYHPTSTVVVRSAEEIDEEMKGEVTE